MSDHESWLKHQSEKCIDCEEKAEKIVTYRINSIYKMHNIAVCLRCFGDRKESFGATERKVREHEFETRSFTREDVVARMAYLRERFWEPYASTVSVVA